MYIYNEKTLGDAYCVGITGMLTGFLLIVAMIVLGNINLVLYDQATTFIIMGMLLFIGGLLVLLLMVPYVKYKIYEDTHIVFRR